MNPLLISGFGTSINVEKSKLIISNKLKNTKYEFYPHKIPHDNIILDNHSGNISFDAIKWLMKHDIQLSILNWNGNLLGVTIPESPKLGNIRIKQYQKYLDHDIRYEIAEKIVCSKIQSSFNLIKELSNYYSIELKSVESTFKSEFENFEMQLKREPSSFSNLLTYEGRIAQAYFGILGVIISQTGTKFAFSGRKRADYSRNYNAADEINALFNYGYAILESEIKKTVNSIGLDPAIGYLHEIYPSRTPLIYDCQELFRWIIDLSIIQLLNEYPRIQNNHTRIQNNHTRIQNNHTRIQNNHSRIQNNHSRIQKSDFIITENYNIRLKEHTASLLIRIIKDNFNKKVSYKGKNYYYHNVLYDNITKLSHFINDKYDQLELNIPGIRLSRNDYVTLRERILKMTPEHRKRLGINKSTLFYMKKNIKNGKSIKLYDKTLSKLDVE